jgi:hypothetical protein
MAGWRPAGQGDVNLSASGNPDEITGSVSLANPEGFERFADGAVRDRIRLPFVASATGRVAPESGSAGIGSARLRFGDHEATASGTVDWRNRAASLSGTVSSPSGQAADFGIREAVSWRRAAANWSIEGAIDSPAVKAQGSADAVGYRAFPPVPLSARVEGSMDDVVYVVADVSADVAQATATGTVTGPLSPKPLQVNASIAARDIDFSKASRWLAAASSPSGFDAAPAVRYMEKLGGRGAADLDFAYSASETSIGGNVRSDEVVLRGVQVRSVSVEGNWKRGPGGEQWRAGGAGEVAGGVVRLAGSGAGAGSDITGSAERIDIAKASALLPGRRIESLGGTGSAEFSARLFADGRIDIPSARVAIAGLTAGGISWGTVTGDGNLGAETGAFRLSSASPAVRH